MILFSCKGKKATIRIYRSDKIVIVDSSASPEKFITSANKTADFPVYYLGYPSDTIRIGKRYWRGRTKWTAPTGGVSVKNFEKNSLRIYVDTESRTNLVLEYFSDSPRTSWDSSLNYHSFLVWINNLSDSAIYIGRTFSVYQMFVEARDLKGKWVKLNKKLSELPLCLAGEPVILLHSGQVLLTKFRRYTGSFVTEFRLVLGTDKDPVYSNTFTDSIEPELLKSFE